MYNRSLRLMNKHGWILLFSLVMALLLADVGDAQTPNPPGPTDDQVNAIAKQLYCPVCENVPLDVCGTQACAQWRDLVRKRLVEGWSEKQIIDYFVNQYGDRVLATPPARGINWLVYIIPPATILVGAFLLFRAFQTWKQPSNKTDLNIPPAPIQDDYIARVEEELKKRTKTKSSSRPER